MNLETRERLDKVLIQISKKEQKLYPVTFILDELSISKEYAGTIVSTLEGNGHIEVKDQRFKWPSIMITDKGKEFIQRTLYVDEFNNADIKLHHVLFTEPIYIFLESKEVLDYKKSYLDVQLTERQLKEYPALIKQKNFFMICAVIELALLLIAVF